MGRMIKNGKFWKYHENEFKVNRDSDGNTIILIKNDKIIGSTFWGEEGTSITQRVMVPNSDFSKYNKYIVSKEIPVRKGVIAPWFEQLGGGIQYQIDPDFVSSIKSKLRPKEDFIDGLVRMRYLDRI